MRTRKISQLLLLAMATMGITSCFPGNRETQPVATVASATSGPVANPVSVEAIQIQTLEIFPVEVNVTVRGELPDSCTSMEPPEQSLDGSTIQLRIAAVQSSDVACPEGTAPFEVSIPLDVIGLPAGIYVVDVNGLQGTFTLPVDNVPDEANAVVVGRIWHDLCDIDGSAVEAAGCIETENGAFTADGQLQEGEPGLGGVIVQLGTGNCPSAGLATTITDGSGDYVFSGLEGGTYCVSIDAFDEQNAPLLLPGAWTNRDSDMPGSATVELPPGGSAPDVNLGWDFQFRAGIADLGVADDEPEQEEACSDAVAFIEDVTIPDDTVLEAGETFTKTWKLSNEGTCTWDSGYSLVFFDGDRLEAPDAVPLVAPVLPGDPAELSVTLAVPEDGQGGSTLRGEWKLRNADGILFGIGEDSTRAFWVQIVVEEGKEG
jgi:hypothetical protein